MSIDALPTTDPPSRTFRTAAIAAGVIALTLAAAGATSLRNTGGADPTSLTSRTGNLDVLVEGPLVSSSAPRSQDFSVLVGGPLVSSAMVLSADLSVLAEGPIVSNAMP